MLTTTAPFDAAAIATVRKPKARVTITWADPYIDLGINATTNDDNRGTNGTTPTTDFGAITNYPNHVADLIEPSARRWAILGQGIVADGTYFVMPGTVEEALSNQVGWIGATAADGSGNFATAPVLTVTFPPRPVITLLVVGDDKYVEFPVDFTVKAFIGATLLHTETVTANALQRWTADVTAINMFAVDKLVLSITKWSAANHVVKITEFFSSIVVVHDGDDILSFDLMEESEIDDGSIPIGNVTSNELTLTLQNIENDFFPGNTNSVFHTLMKRNRKIEPEIGLTLPDTSVEFLPLGVFWSGDWSTPEQGTGATTTARDRLELLRKLTFDSDVLQGLTLNAIAVIILEDARLLMPDMTFTIDSTFGTAVIPFAWFEKQSHMTALKKVVEAGIGRIYTDRTGRVIIEAFDLTGTSADITIEEDNYFSKQNPADTDKLANLVEVTTQPLLPATVAEEVYVQKEAITVAAGGSTGAVNVKYSDPPVIEAAAAAYAVDVGDSLARDVNDVITSPAVTVSASTFYAWGATITATNTQGSQKDIIIVITGKPLTIQGSEVIESIDADSQREFGVLRFAYKDNPLVQIRALAQTVADALLDSYKQPRKDTSLNWRGNPAVEISDVFDAPVFVDDILNIRGRFRAFRNKLNFDGTLRGTLEGRKIFEYVVATLIQGTNDNTDPKRQNTNSTSDPRVQGISSTV